MSNTKIPVVRCGGPCQRSVKELEEVGVKYVPLPFAAAFIKDVVSRIMEKHGKELKELIPGAWHALHAIRKSNRDAILCRDCVSAYLDLILRAEREKQKALKLSVPDTIPLNHPDTLRKDEAPITAGEDRTLREVLRSMNSGNGPAPDGVK